MEPSNGPPSNDPPIPTSRSYRIHSLPDNRADVHSGGGVVREIKNRKVVVRKKHPCAWCGEWVGKGEKAVYRVYIFYDFMHDWMHPECNQAMRDSDWEADEGFELFNQLRGETLEVSHD